MQNMSKIAFLGTFCHPFPTYKHSCVISTPNTTFEPDSHLSPVYKQAITLCREANHAEIGIIGTGEFQNTVFRFCLSDENTP